LGEHGHQQQQVRVLFWPLQEMKNWQTCHALLSTDMHMLHIIGVYATSDEMQPATNVADALLIRLDFFFDFFDLVAFGFGVCRLQPNAATFGALT